MTGEFEHIVLLAVARMRGDGYGMTIRREIERRTGRAVSIGAVYATLDRLERKGWVSSSERDATARRAGRARRYFRLEPAGAAAVLEAKRVLERMWEDVELDATPEGA